MASHDDAMKKRIITHMNTDHRDSAIRYLEHYCHVSSFAARNARLVDISLSSMRISAGNKTYTIAFSPPMNSLHDARNRVIQMDREATAALGRSDITVRTYAPPKGFHLLVFVVCLATYVCFSRRSNFQPGSLLYTNVFGHVPGFARFCAAVQRVIIVLMLVIHFTECYFIATTRLAKHTVPTGGALWWTWIISCFIEGFGAFQRVDALVEKERIKKESKKH